MTKQTLKNAIVKAIIKNGNDTMEVPNIHKVPAKTWRCWCPHARRVFNQVHRDFMDQSAIDPLGPKLGRAQWQTLRWNAAWLAAVATNGV